MITVIRILFPREFQKSVTSIASAKLEKLQDAGSPRAPAMSLVISEGCLNAMMIVIYSGKKIVRQPMISKIVTSQLVCAVCLFPFLFIITAPPSYP